MSILLLIFSALSTVSSNGTIALSSWEVSNVTSTLTNAGSSILSMFMQFRQPIVILAVILWIIGFILNKMGHKW